MFFPELFCVIKNSSFQAMTKQQFGLSYSTLSINAKVENFYLLFVQENDCYLSRAKVDKTMYSNKINFLNQIRSTWMHECDGYLAWELAKALVKHSYGCIWVDHESVTLGSTSSP